MSDSLWISLGALAQAIITGVAGAVVIIMSARHKHQSAAKAQEFTEQGQIIDRQEKHIARQDAQIAELQEAVDHLREQHGRCREESAQMRIFMQVLLDALHKAKIAIEVPPELLKSHDEDDSDFVAKTQAQNTLLLKAESEKLKEGHHENPGH